MGHRLWPLCDLSVRTPRLELRYPDETLLFELAELATGDIHPTDTMPFAVPWRDASPDERGRATLQHHWHGRGTWTADDWRCPMVAVVTAK